MKNVIKLRNHEYPWELEQALGEFVDYYNKQRYHEALDNMTPEEVYLGREKVVQTKKGEDQGGHTKTPKKMEPGDSHRMAVDPKSEGGNTLLVMDSFVPNALRTYTR